MLIDEVKLEVLDATSRKGRKEVGVYFTRYSNMKAGRWFQQYWMAARASTVLPTGNFVELTTKGTESR